MPLEPIAVVRRSPPPPSRSTRRPGRILLVSNRLPLSVRAGAEGIELTRSSGGLVAALRSPHERLGGLWIGWPGDTTEDDTGRAAVTEYLRGAGAVPIFLSTHERKAFYDGFSNGVLWPLFHSQVDRLPLDASSDWRIYREVSLRFAREIARVAEPDDLVWIHDYQLALVPEMLRVLRPGLRSGFFLHIPFPSPDVFRVLPWRREILRGLLGSDVLGVHTRRDLEHLFGAIAELLPEARRLEDRVILDGHSTRADVYPIGVDVDAIESAARSPEVEAALARIREEARGKRVLLGVDRLDYTKGIPRRLLAVDGLLRRWPELREQVHFIQIAVPSRESVDAYGKFRRMVNELVGRINARHGTTASVPIHLLYRSVSFEELVALYRAADVMVVTPLRDGMNLVAKEYVAARIDGGGALVLSELAGAAAQLARPDGPGGQRDGALVVNPYDIQAVAEAMRAALFLEPADGRSRMSALRRAVSDLTAQAWAERFLDDLAHVPGKASPDLSPLDDAILHLAAEPCVTVLLDYDGTLVPFASTPDAARPDAELLALLKHVARLPGVTLHVVSGRSRPSLDAFFSDVPAWLHAEHGAWTRPHDGPWRGRLPERPSWFAEARRLLEGAAAALPGSSVEEKTFGLAFHVRQAKSDPGPVLAALRMRLEELSALTARPPTAQRAHDDLVIRPGDHVLEVRPRGVHKGVVVEELAREGRLAAVLAAGDDLTDEDLFAALPASALSIHVGAPRRTQATHRVDGPTALRALLQHFSELRVRVGGVRA